MICILSTSMNVTFAQATSEHTDNHNHETTSEGKHKEKNGDEHHEEGYITITTANAKAGGIINAKASAGEIKNMLTVYGRVVISPESISRVRARFPGLLTKLTVNVGDTVSAGEIIAQVESNNSFKRYNISAPISGVVTQRLVNPGESITEQTLIAIENYHQLWVDYKIFPSQVHAIKKGQTVILLPETEQKSSTITHLMANRNQTFITAKVPLDNRANLWTPGQILKGNVITSKVNVAMVVDNRAFQEVEGKRVIFVKNQEGYETRELKIGRSDSQFSEVLSGLNIGEQYALINSYLLKADLGKAGATHAH